MMLPPDPVYVFRGEMNPVTCVSYSSKGGIQFIYAGTESGIVHIWSLKVNFGYH